jgi:hypothetical protein
MFNINFDNRKKIKRIFQTEAAILDEGFYHAGKPVFQSCPIHSYAGRHETKRYHYSDPFTEIF